MVFQKTRRLGQPHLPLRWFHRILGMVAAVLETVVVVAMEVVVVTVAARLNPTSSLSSLASTLPLFLGSPTIRRQSVSTSLNSSIFLELSRKPATSRTRTSSMPHRLSRIRSWSSSSGILLAVSHRREVGIQA